MGADLSPLFRGPGGAHSVDESTPNGDCRFRSRGRVFGRGRGRRDAWIYRGPMSAPAIRKMRDFAELARVK